MSLLAQDGQQLAFRLHQYDSCFLSSLPSAGSTNVAWSDAVVLAELAAEVP